MTTETASLDSHVVCASVIVTHVNFFGQEISRKMLVRKYQTRRVLPARGETFDLNGLRVTHTRHDHVAGHYVVWLQDVNFRSKAAFDYAVKSLGLQGWV